jgi:fructokinase
MLPHKVPFADVLPNLVSRISAMTQRDGRRLVAIAGSPAGGKSTLSARLTEALGEKGINAANIPMDGFHLDNRILAKRNLLKRKGAPETFDAAGFLTLMRRLKSEGEVVYPIFDRSRDIAIAGACLVPARCDVAIVEGNYLLFAEPPWDKLAQMWDLSVWLDTSVDVVLNRCVQRWIDHGHTPEAARARALENDVANARRIAAARLPADVTIADKAPANAT